VRYYYYYYGYSVYQGYVEQTLSDLHTPFTLRLNPLPHFESSFLLCLELSFATLFFLLLEYVLCFQILLFELY